LGALAVASFFCHRFGKHKGCLTKRAPDVWDSAAFSSIFLASSFFYFQAESMFTLPPPQTISLSI
jgi:hypothetical protein